MQKQAPTAGRMLVMVGFALSCFGLLLFLWLAFGGPIPLKPKGYQFKVSFAEGTQLAVEADVRISGVPVGKVKTIETDKDTGRSIATVQMEEKYAPVAKDTKAILRQKTLLGETYVELTPGHPKQAGLLPEDGSLPAAQISPTVELDEIFRAFDPKTRQAFQTWMQSNAQAVNGRARDISDALGNLEPFAEDADVLLQILNSQKGAVRQVVKNTGVVFDALSERRGQLQGAIRNSNAVFQTTAQRNADLQDLFRVLPTFNRESATTVKRLTAFANNTNPLVNQLHPAAREFSPTFQQLEKLAPDLRALFRDLDPLITVSKKGLPATRRFLGDLRPFLGELDPLLKQLNPIASWLYSYRNEVRSFFPGAVGATQATTPDGVHYLRTENPQNPENYAVYPRRLGSNRPNPYMFSKGFDNVGRGGLFAYETRHCGNGNPVVAAQQDLANALQAALPFLQGAVTNPGSALANPPSANSLAANILTYGFANAGRNTPQVQCRQQAKFAVDEGQVNPNGAGEVTLYPHVREAATSTRVPGE